jgi:ribonucleotide reductase alpha subunit
MQVIKRDGSKESVKFDKISSRINKLTYGLNQDFVKYQEVAQKVIAGVRDGITTEELDNLAAETAASMTINHPDYSILAGRIAISSLHKRIETTVSPKKKFSEIIERLYSYKHPKTGENAGLIIKEVYDVIQANKNVIDEAIIYNRDYNFDYFGFKTLEKSYLLKVDGKVIETPQTMYMRVAMGIWWNDIDNALKTYELLSNGLFTHATPTLFNAGTVRPQLSSCFLLGTNDSIDGIFKTVTDSALISKNAGGIGIHMSNVRAKNSYIRGTNGNSNGLIPFLKVLNETARAVDQCFAENTLVKTDNSKNSWKKISSLEEGDTIMAQGGTFHKINKVKKYEHVDHNIYKIKFSNNFVNFDDDNYVTDSHPLLVKNEDNKLGAWLEVDLINKGDKIGFPILALGDLFERLIEVDLLMGHVSDFEILGDEIFFTVESITPVKDYNGPFYDLEIEDNHSYVTSIGLAHNGGGRRKGSFAIYMEPWHADIFEFLDLRKNHGKEEMRARDLFLAMWIPDLFMQRVEQDGDWTLFCPNEAPGLTDVYDTEDNKAFTQLYTYYEEKGMGRKVVKARSVFNKILESQIETGTPYMLYKDACNGKSNQKNIGTIKSSNLCCIAGDQRVPTDRGILTVKELYDLGGENKVVGREKIETASQMFLPRPNAEMGMIVTDEGYTHKVTPDHSVWVKDYGWKEAKDLVEGDKILIQQIEGLFGELDMEDEVKQILSQLEFLEEVPPFIWESNKNTVICLLRGLFDLNQGKFRFFSHFDNIVSDIQILISNLGIKTQCFYDSENGWFELKPANENNFNKLNHILYGDGDSFQIEDEDEMYAKFKEYVKLPNEDAYCLTVNSDEHSWTVNGLVTKNSEIIEYSDDKEYAVCNLASIALSSFVDIPTGKVISKDKSKRTVNYQKLHEVAYQITVNLNRVIDINYYPTPETKKSNLRHRPIGIGVQGMADMYAMLGIPFTSEEARDINKKVFETIYHAFLSASCDLAKKDGHYETFKGSPASEGKLQYHLWGLDENSLSGMWDFTSLIEDIKKYGLRNSLGLTMMPTASTSQILGNNEAIEPFTSNVYKRNTLTGEYIIANKHLIKDLIENGLWNETTKLKIITGGGSIQHIDEIPDSFKEVYKTVWEIKQKDLIEMSADRGAFVCQSQSFNMFMQDVTMQKLFSAHLYGWKKGLKTGMYYLRTQAATSAMQGLGIDTSKLKEIESEPVKVISKEELVENMTPEQYSQWLAIQREKAMSGDDCEMCGS